MLKQTRKVREVLLVSDGIRLTDLGGRGKQVRLRMQESTDLRGV